MTLNGKTVDKSTLHISGIRHYDAPDYVDAYYESAQYEDGTDLTDAELDRLNLIYPACERIHERYEV